MHLLSRLLAFDPARRCSAEEGLAHEYLHSFEAIELQMGESTAWHLVFTLDFTLKALQLLCCHLLQKTFGTPG